MENRKLISALTVTALSLVALCLVLIGATFAWFSFSPFTNVTPMEGRISKGDVNLLISESPDGPFTRRCALNPLYLPDTLEPVSTVDLNRFFIDTLQDQEGYSVAFEEITEDMGDYLMYGTVYLQSLLGSCDVYFQVPDLNISGNDQMLSSGRLGLRFTDEAGNVSTFLFKLDALGDTSNAQLRLTVKKNNAVLSGIEEDGAPIFANDPALSIANYLVDNEQRQKLLTLSSGQIARVEYWLYLEGCDTACYNPLHTQEITFQLGFAGETVTEEEASTADAE